MFGKWGKTPAPLLSTDHIDDSNYDCVVIVAPGIHEVKSLSHDFHHLLAKQQKVDVNLENEGCLLSYSCHSRFVYAPVGRLDRDFDDVRRFGEAAAKGIKRALSAGSVKPLLAVVPHPQFHHSKLVAVLGAFKQLYSPLQYREDVPDKAFKVEKLGIFGASEETESIMHLAIGLESGRVIARDIGGGDPERMAPPNAADYIKEVFKSSPVTVEVNDSDEVFVKEYPLFAAVNRAASVIPRHKGRIVYLTYEGEGPIKTTIMPCGKGITYDTGGADIKAGGIMAGMSRDKCGAAAVAGFFQILAYFRPKGIKAIGALALARNSVGENCYVADEVITSRAGLRCRIGNTDAEGRNVMTDPLCRLKELSLSEVNPHLMTVATLTGHVCIAYGTEYSAVMDNGNAAKLKFAQKMQEVGEAVGEPMEISTIRREDYEFVKSNDLNIRTGYVLTVGDAEGEDLLQCNNLASSRTPRGHQFPAAFMIEASGLSQHGIDSKTPLKYTHFDIAGSSGKFPQKPTGVPIISWAKYFFGDQINL